MKDYDKNKKPSYIDISFSSERSVQDEIVRVSQGEIGTAVISYVVMFAYIAISLGNIRSLKTFLVMLITYYFVLFSISIFLSTLIYAGVRCSILSEFDLFSKSQCYLLKRSLILRFLCFVFQLDSKITLGVVGILIVLSSVGCSLGFFGYLGVPTTLLIVEVGIIRSITYCST